MNTRAVGAAYEDLACRQLEKAGMEILARNYRVRAGEIDIIARDKEELVFAEVKYRKNRLYGGAEYAISEAKKQKIRKVAQWFMAQNHLLPDETFCRFDAVLIDENDRVTHIPNAW